MLGETEKSSDVCRTASLSEMGQEQSLAVRSSPGCETYRDWRSTNFTDPIAKSAE